LCEREYFCICTWLRVSKFVCLRAFPWVHLYVCTCVLLKLPLWICAWEKARARVRERQRDRRWESARVSEKREKGRGRERSYRPRMHLIDASCSCCRDVSPALSLQPHTRSIHWRSSSLKSAGPGHEKFLWCTVTNRFGAVRRSAKKKREISDPVIEWFWPQIFRTNLVRGPWNKEMNFQNKGAVLVQIAPLFV